MQADLAEMCVADTPVEHHPDWGLWVKREDLCCPGGPNFSKARGVFRHVAARSEKVIGVLDTSHSQGGWAVARACGLLGKHCVLYYPVRKSEEGLRVKPQQEAAKALGAELLPLQAGRSAVLYHHAKRYLGECHSSSYMMPNALKLPESVDETYNEFMRLALPLDEVPCVLVSASSGTIAAGVLRGLGRLPWRGMLVIHLGYSRPHKAVMQYVRRMAGEPEHRTQVCLVDEDYSYAEEARLTPTPPWPCNKYYDLKAFRWWCVEGREKYGSALFWNIG